MDHPLDRAFAFWGKLCAQRPWAVLSLGLLLCTLIASLVFEARFTQRAKQDMRALCVKVCKRLIENYDFLLHRKR